MLNMLVEYDLIFSNVINSHPYLTAITVYILMGVVTCLIDEIKQMD